MPNLFDYLKWRGDLPLAADGLNAVDNLALCCLAYVNFSAAVPADPAAPAPTLREAATRFFAQPPEQRLSRVEEDQRLLAAMAESERFGPLRVAYYVNEIDLAEQTQFSALTFLWPGHLFVSYCGTDNTLVGWKEDFNMSFLPEVPAQRRAAEYLRRAAGALPGALSVGGHSKGGNLAVYAAARCSGELLPRLRAVYNNDGPGFGTHFLDEPDYQAVRERVQTFVPQSSVVGMLLEHEETYTVVHSTQMGILQHDPYSWEMEGPDFVRLDSVTRGSRFLDRTLRTWVSEMDVAQRTQLIDTLYGVFDATEARTLGDLSAAWLKNSGKILQSFTSLDPDAKQLVFQMISLLFASAKKNLRGRKPESAAERPGADRRIGRGGEGAHDS